MPDCGLSRDGLTSGGTTGSHLHIRPRIAPVPWKPVARASNESRHEAGALRWRRNSTRSCLFARWRMCRESEDMRTDSWARVAHPPGPYTPDGVLHLKRRHTTWATQVDHFLRGGRWPRHAAFVLRAPMGRRVRATRGSLWLRAVETAGSGCPLVPGACSRPPGQTC